MLVMFLLAVTCAWAAVSMVFQVSLINVLLGILAAFFLLRGVELADKINHLGPYAEQVKGDDKNEPGNEELQSGDEDSGDKLSPDEE